MFRIGDVRVGRVGQEKTRENDALIWFYNYRCRCRCWEKATEIEKSRDWRFGLKEATNISAR